MKKLSKIIDKIPFDKLADFPSYQRWITIVLIQILLMGGYYFGIHMMTGDEISELNKNFSELEVEIKKLKKAAKVLPKLEKEIADMENDLVVARSKLPSDKEIPKLLNDISNIGTQVGLDFSEFKPMTEVPQPYYIKVPVSLNIIGPFHSILMFFYNISKMPRIVSISNVQFTSPKEIGKELLVTMKCLATTFRYKEITVAAKTTKK